MSIGTGTSTHIIMRLQLDVEVFSFGEIASCISAGGGDIIGVDVISSSRTQSVRDITVNVHGVKQRELISELLPKLKGVKVIEIEENVFSDIKHPFGNSPLHYTKDVYKKMVMMIDDHVRSL